MSSIFGAKNEKEIGEQKQEQLNAKVITIQSGIPGFDESLGQGLPTGNLYLLSGSLASSSGLFAQQILYHVIIQKGKVEYYTVENSGVDIAEDMKMFGMNIQQYVDDGSWIFARVIPSNMKKIIEALPENPMEKRIELTDSLLPLMTHFHDSVKEGYNSAIHISHLIRNFPLEEIQNILYYMIGVARRYGGIHFVVLNEEAHDQKVLATIKDSVDAVFEIKGEIKSSALENTVTIQKIRNMMPKSRLLRLAINDTGLVTDTIRRMQ